MERERERELYLVDRERTRVLAVDDSPDNLFLVEHLLRKNGATVETAENGEEALEKAARGEFDIVLMDIQMPRMDGYQSKRALDERGYGRPIVALTAHAMQDEQTKTREAGFAAHLTKPLDHAELVKTISRLVHGSAGRGPQLPGLP